MDITPNSEICLKCFLQPYSSTALIFGLEFFGPCTCEIPSCYNSLFDQCKVIYFQFVEFILWGNFFLPFLSSIPGIDQSMPCSDSFDKVNRNDAIFYKVLLSLLAFNAAFGFSWLKRNKVPSNLKLRNLSNADKINLSIKFHKIWLANLSLIIIFIMAFLYSNVITMFPAFKQNDSDLETLFYKVQDLISSILLSGIIIHFCMMGLITLMILYKGFQRMSESLYLLKPTNSNLECELETLMVQHADLWTCLDDTLSVFEYPLTLIYSGTLLCICLGFYALIFVDMDGELKYPLLFGLINCGTGCVFSGFLISLVIAAMQNSFQDIRRFAKCDLRLEFKLKILNFMKRFGKAALCPNLCGYISISKKMPIKMASSLHSIFDSLLNLRRTENNKRSCELASSANATNSFQLN